MRKRTSRIFPDGKTECYEVYAPFNDGWQYCDAIYKCDENGVMTCLWEKLASATNRFGYIATTIWNNEYYAYGEILEKDTNSNEYINSGRYVIAKYNYSRRVYEKICQLSEYVFKGYTNLTNYSMIVLDNGYLFSVYSSSLGMYLYSFFDKNGNKIDLPSEEVQFMTGTRSVFNFPFNRVITNKGIISFTTNTGFFYKDFDGNTISSLPYSFDNANTEGGVTLSNGTLYAYRTKQYYENGLYEVYIGKLTLENDELKDFSIVSEETYEDGSPLVSYIEKTNYHGVVVVFGDNRVYKNINQEVLFETGYLLDICGETQDDFTFGWGSAIYFFVRKGISGTTIQYSNYDRNKPMCVLFKDEDGEEHIFNRFCEIYENGTIEIAVLKYDFIEE